MRCVSGGNIGCSRWVPSSFFGWDTVRYPPARSTKHAAAAAAARDCVATPAQGGHRQHELRQHAALLVRAHRPDADPPRLPHAVVQRGRDGCGADQGAAPPA
eukprot:130473-Prymnesium_polylepis.1